MFTSNRNWIILLVFSLAAISRLGAQDNLPTLKSEWKARRWDEVLLPLLDYRDIHADEANFEVDFMIGTTMCHVKEYSDDGRRYLSRLMDAYPPAVRTLDGRSISIPLAIKAHCGEEMPADDKAAPVNNSDGATSATTIAMLNTAPKSALEIREDVKKRLLRSSLVLEVGVDRPGHDYRSFDLDSPQPDLCRQECAKEQQCKAFTFVRPASQGAKARCSLKSAVPERSADKCCLSAVK